MVDFDYIKIFSCLQASQQAQKIYRCKREWYTYIESSDISPPFLGASQQLGELRCMTPTLLKGLDRRAVSGRLVFSRLVEKEGGRDIGRRDGSGIPGGGVGEGRAAVWRAAMVCVAG